jgi:polyribonucleotide nucleotidyltransferase
MHKIFNLPECGIEVEIGRYARQADGAVWIKAGNCVVLCTAVASKEPKDILGFFPLTVEYRERTSAAGRIPGGYFKREGKLSDAEVLISRLIDRPIRPLFPSTYFNEVQLMSTVYSSDGQFPTGILSIIGSSLALAISPAPFLGPVGAVMATRINNAWKFNPTFEELADADTSITIAGTKNGICMVEGHCNNLPEKDLVELLFVAHEEIKKQIVWQESIVQELKIVKTEPAATIDWADWKKRVLAALPANFGEQLFEATKVERSDGVDAIKKTMLESFKEDIKEGKINAGSLNFIFDSLKKEVLPDLISAKNARVDGRPFNQVRPIEVSVGALPCVHGSALFQRGETQVLASVTLGTGQDAQKIDSLIGGAQEREFMLHYNFPPFATGEVKPLRGAGRREIGHGFLAETSFLNVLPKSDTFPYVLRSVCDVLESNGSSSMATVCATTMALMDAGVPITEMVGGVAMGLIRDSKDNLHVLTDILGMEDALGLMDFKVVGSERGILAFQLDIKDKMGLTRELLINALEHARVARLHILGEMKKVMTAPRAELSRLAPRVTSFKVPSDKIGLIIGPGGKNIKEIIAQTGTQIDIEDDGTVKIYSKTGDGAAEAENWIRVLCGDIEIGSIFNGTVKRVADFGLIVELVSGKEGMVHISTIARSKQNSLPNLVKLNDKLSVRVVAIDRETGRIKLISPELEKS